MKYKLPASLFLILSCGFFAETSAYYISPGPSANAMGRFCLYGSGFFHNYSSLDEFVICEEANTEFVKCSFFSKMYVEGRATLQDCVFHHHLMLWGRMVAESTQFRMALKIYGGYAHLSNCKVSDLIILNENSYETAIVKLSENTEINGDIIFTNGCGKVYADPSVIIHGNVLGGTLLEQ